MISSQYLSLRISKQTQKNLQFLWGFTKNHQTKIGITIIAMVITALTEPAIAYLFKIMIDDASIQQNAAMILLVPIFLVVIFFIRSLSSLLSVYLSNWVANTVIRDLRSLVFSHFLKLKQSYLDRKSASKLLSKITYDVEQVSGTIVDAWVILIKDSLTVVSLLGLLLYLNFQLSLIIFIGAPIIVYIFKYLSKRIKSINLVIQQAMGSLTQITEESLSLLKLIKTFNTQKSTNEKFSDVIRNLRAQKMKAIVANELNVSIIQLVVAITVAVVIYLALSSNMSTGDIVAYTTAVSIIFSPFKRLAGVNSIIQRALAALDSIEKVLVTPTEHETGRRKLKKIKGEIEFAHLAFKYNQNHEKSLFEDLNLKIEAGNIVAFVGNSGSGKSTLVHLLLRFYDWQGGQVLLDGVDIREYTLKSLRNQLSLVEQTVMLFNDTLRENITMGVSGITDEQINHALKIADAYDFVYSMPDGLNTHLSDRGLNLSGGQRQRIAIARALVNPAPVLILDEATSALDNASEARIQEAIFKERRGKTTIIIAHRLSSIKNADCIYVLNDGKVSEMGKHEELIVKQGIYANLYLNEPKPTSQVKAKSEAKAEPTEL